MQHLDSTLNDTFDDTPPWGKDFVSPNPLDAKMPYKKPNSVFDFATPAKKKANILESKDSIQSTNINKTQNIESKNEDSMKNIESNLQNVTQNNNLANLDSIESKSLDSIKNATLQNLNSKNTESKESKNSIESKPQTSQALALKYRPKTFQELIGQDSVAKTLSLALDSQKIANAYLFSGLRGSGKTSSARIFARCLECESKITSKPCGVCVNCKEALKGTHIDIIELDGASNRGIDAIRDLIEQTKYRPVLGRFKIFIIDEVHMLTKEAFNSLLKTLEEPPSFVKFILATTDPLKLPPTILSRTQHYRFKQIATSVLRAHLERIIALEGVRADSDALNMLIRNGSGSVRDTLTLLDQAIVYCGGNVTSTLVADMLGSLDLSAFDVLFNALLRRDMAACVAFVREISSFEIEMILDTLSVYIREKMLLETPQISPILGMRYGNIIADSKAMLHLDCDGEFCLLLCVLKMLEAQKLREIESAIKQMESGVKIVDSKATDSIESKSANSMQNANINASSETLDSKKSIESNLDSKNLQNIESKIESKVESKPVNVSQSTPKYPKNLSDIFPQNLDSKFQTLINKIYDRDFHIGEFFEKKVAFNGINGNELCVTFYADESEIDKVRKGYEGIKTLIFEVYGNNVKLKVDKKTNEHLQTLLTTPLNPPKQDSIESSAETAESMESIESKPPDSNDINNITEFDAQNYQDEVLPQQDYINPNILAQNTESNPPDSISNKAFHVNNFMNENKEILQDMKEHLGVKNINIVGLDLPNITN